MMLAHASAFAAPVLNFPAGFAGSTTTLNFNNAAQISGTRARLTSGSTLEVGSVWSKNQVDVRKFSCQFSFQITPVSGNYEAGFTFVLQRAGNTVSGYPYESLGYSPMNPSIAVKFDTWPSVSTTGVYSNGASPDDNPPASVDMAPAGINLQSGHIFNVSLVYDGVTLQQTVTDTLTNATFTRNYTIDIATIIDGAHAYAGFTASTGGTGSIHEILTWTYSVTSSSYDVSFTAFPERLQLYARNRTTNMATVPVTGSEAMGGFTQAVVRIYRNGVQVGGDQVQALTYPLPNGAAPFSFSPTIPAELAHYDIELLLRNGSNQLVSVQRAQDIVAGDVFVIEGQSNAVSKTISGSASAYTSPFIRTVGIESGWPSAGLSTTAWMTATGDGTLNNDDLGDVGQWGLVMANQIMSSNNVPIAVINSGFGGQLIAFFQRNDANHLDPNTNYGRLFRRLQRAGVAGGVRSILFWQGESDANNGASHQVGFTALRSDWLEDYPSLEKIYVFQVRECPCGPVDRFNVDLRNRQRLFADQFPNLAIMSVTALDGHDGCHFSFANGYQNIGLNIARMLQRDLYNGASLANTDPPNPAYAVLTGANKNLIRIPLRKRTDAITFNPGAIADFAVVGSAVSITSGTVANGILALNLSGNATGATSVIYTGHAGPATGNWVSNGNGVGLLSFSEPLIVDTTPPVITLLGSNPFTLNQGATYTEPGATATDNVDGNLTSSIVINASAVNTAVPGDYPVTYNVTDVAGNAATQVTRTVHVTANSPPTADPQSVTTNEDTAKAITLTGSDPNGDPLTFIVVTNPTHGILSGTAPNLTYTPAANYNGADSFTFKVNDGAANSNIATVSITDNPVNDAPAAAPQSVTTNEDTAKGITLGGTDIDGDSLSFNVVTSPVHGALSGTAPNLTYTPAANYNGPDSFTFKVNDGTVDSAPATVSITVNAVNDAPTAAPQSVTTSEDTAKAITLSGSDVEGSSLTFSIVTGPAHGALSGTVPNLTYTPTTNYNGPDSFTFKANDGTLDSAPATISITVNPVNDTPTATPQSVSTNEDTAKAITLGGSDVDGDTLTFNVVTGPTHGALSGTAPNLTYTPTANYNGSDSFTFKVNDGTVDSTPATVSITVNAVNDAPTATPQSVTTNEDTAKAITLTGSDVEGSSLTFGIVTGPAHGALSGAPPNVTYTPAANYNGADSFTFKANDGTVDSTPATVSITVNPINDTPAADPQSVTTNEDTAKAITLSGSDVDGDALTFNVITGPTHGALSGTAPNLTYTPAPNYNGDDSFTFKVNDGTVDSTPATISITVNAVNDAPTAQPQSVSTSEDTAKAITLSGSDVEGSSLTFSVVTGPAHGALSGAPPNVTYTPAANYNGSDSFTFKVNDGTTDSLAATVSITVTPVNDPPTANDQSVATNASTPKAITLTGSDIETPSNSLTFTITASPTHGTLTGAPPNITYHPDAFDGSDSFKFTVTDTGDGASAPLTSSEATVSISISIAPEIAIEQPAGTDLSDGLSTVDFGDVSVDDDNSHTFTIRNLGSADLTDLGITIDGADAADFTITAPPTAPVPPGGSTTFTIKFAPAALDTRVAALHLVSNDADENPFDIALTGTGITNLEAWRLLYFGNMDDNGPGGDTNDPDFDGVSNVLEFATGSDPEQSNPMPGILNLNGETIEFVYTRTKAAMNDGFTFQVEYSDDLASPNWSSTGVSEEILSDNGTLQEVKASVAVGNGTRRLLHLKITQP
jgi:hypothetical protein